MRVRGAAGLLLAPVLWVVARAFDVATYSSARSIHDGLENLVWTQSDAASDRLVAVGRDGILALVVVVALVGLAGRGRFVVALAALVQGVLFAPWAYYDITGRSSRFPKRWVRWIPGYPAPNFTALLWIVLMVVVFVVAVSAGKPVAKELVQAARAQAATMGPPPGWGDDGAPAVPVGPPPTSYPPATQQPPTPQPPTIVVPPGPPSSPGPTPAPPGPPSFGPGAGAAGAAPSPWPGQGPDDDPTTVLPPS